MRSGLTIETLKRRQLRTFCVHIVNLEILNTKTNFKPMNPPSALENVSKPEVF